MWILSIMSYSLPPRPCPHTLGQRHNSGKLILYLSLSHWRASRRLFCAVYQFKGIDSVAPDGISDLFTAHLGSLQRQPATGQRIAYTVWAFSTHRQYKRISIDTAPSWITKFSIIHTMQVLKIPPKHKLPQVTLLSKLHSRLRPSSCIHCSHWLVYFLPYAASARASLASLPRGQRALCLLLMLLVHKNS